MPPRPPFPLVARQDAVDRGRPLGLTGDSLDRATFWLVVVFALGFVILAAVLVGGRRRRPPRDP